jgi:lipopolysaccharide biosynthesis regulator YciM
MEVFKRTSKRAAGSAGAVFLVAVLLAAAAIAVGAEQTREGYVAQVEPICKVNTQANERILQGVRGKIKQGKLKAASGQFSKAATAFEKAVKELRAVPQPTEDTAKLTKWLTQLDSQTGYLRDMAKALKEGKKQRVVALQSQLVRNAEAANSTVLSFGFKYCKIDGAKFT